jgi:hypothetical protein
MNEQSYEARLERILSQQAAVKLQEMGGLGKKKKKGFFQKLSKSIKKKTKKLMPKLRTAAKVVAGAAAIYFSGGTATPLVAGVLMKDRNIAKKLGMKAKTKDSQQLIADMAADEQALMEKDPAYAAKLRSMAASDPAVKQAAQADQFTKLAVPVAAIAAAAALMS